jgi:hypothetical protein
MRRYPEIGPEFLRGIGGPAVLLLFCLAPHGVFPAISLTRDAVSSYLAFSPLPALFSKNRRYLLCDTFRQRSLSRTPPAYSTRHAAVWCSDFPLANLATDQRPSAIANKLTSLGNRGKQEVNQEPKLEGIPNFFTVAFALSHPSQILQLTPGEFCRDCGRNLAPAGSHGLSPKSGCCINRRQGQL